jgi:hypothetical protein
MNRLRPFAVINQPHTGVPPDPSVAIELADTDRGFLPNRLTTAQRDAIADPAPGLLIYNTDDSVYQFFDGLAWNAIGGSGSGLVSLSSGTITTPVAFADIELPNIPSEFHYEFRSHGWEIDGGGDNLSIRTSEDGGTTFFAGSTDYKQNYMSWAGINLASNSASLDKGLLTQAAILTGEPNYVFYYINPGSDTTKPIIYGRAFHAQAGSIISELVDIVVEPASARQTTIRVGAFFG